MIKITWIKWILTDLSCEIGMLDRRILERGGETESISDNPCLTYLFQGLNPIRA